MIRQSADSMERWIRNGANRPKAKAGAGKLQNGQKGPGPAAKPQQSGEPKSDRTHLSSEARREGPSVSGSLLGGLLDTYA